VSLPILLTPVLFYVVLPATFGIVGGSVTVDSPEFRELLDVMPAAFQREVAGLDARAQLLVWAFEYAFASLFLIVPLMTSTVIAADSFAGERERKTLEALVYTPVSDRDLYLAKAAAPWLAAMAVALLGYVAYAIVANLVAAGPVGRPLVLTLRWLLVLVWLTPAIAAAAVGALVLVSARVRGFQEAYQLGGLVVLPLVALLVSQLTGALYLEIGLIVLIGAVVWVVAIVVLRLGYRSFRRERLLTGGP
jgi:ABC-type transport system involved in multi-copper enzyme maturation permease subunit